MNSDAYGKGFWIFSCCSFFFYNWFGRMEFWIPMGNPHGYGPGLSTGSNRPTVCHIKRNHPDHAMRFPLSPKCWHLPELQSPTAGLTLPLVQYHCHICNYSGIWRHFRDLWYRTLGFRTSKLLMKTYSSNRFHAHLKPEVLIWIICFTILKVMLMGISF